MKYVLVNIGCIECSVSSNIVGVFSDKIKAEELADKLQESHGWREGGQNDFQVFDLPEVDAPINEEYRE